jgi:cyclohexyl-isocyanide hydratase
MLLFPNLTQLDLTGPYEVFARMPDTTVTLVAEAPAPVSSERGLTITPDTTFAVG